MSAPEWAVVPPAPPRHVCALPDAKEHPVGTVIVCKHGIKRPEPPKAHRGKGYKPPPAIPCGIHWRVGRTWWMRDHVWRQVSAGYGAMWL